MKTNLVTVPTGSQSQHCDVNHGSNSAHCRQSGAVRLTSLTPKVWDGAKCNLSSSTQSSASQSSCQLASVQVRLSRHVGHGTLWHSTSCLADNPAWQAIQAPHRAENKLLTSSARRLQIRPSRAEARAPTGRPESKLLRHLRATQPSRPASRPFGAGPTPCWAQSTPSVGHIHPCRLNPRGRHRGRLARDRCLAGPNTPWLLQDALG